MKQRLPWVLILVASSILMITMGARQSLGLFLSPINTHTGLGIAKISFAMAIAQLVWGAVQPVFGAVADRWGPGRVIVLGALLLSAGCAMTTQVTIVLGERKQVLAIPQTALGKRLGEHEYEVTLLIEDVQKETRRIKTGMKDDIKIEVVSGLNDQDKVTLEQGKPVQNDEMEMVP